MSFFAHIEAHKGPSYKLKFLVTSRPYDYLEERFQSLSGVSTYLHFDGDDKSQRIDQDINLVIDREMPRIAKGFSVEHCKCITVRLKAMNNRINLWLFLTIDYHHGTRLCVCGRALMSNRRIRLTQSRNIPCEQEGAVKRVLKFLSDYLSRF